MRVVFAGTPQIAVPTLRAIVNAGHDVVAAVTQPDARGKRGSALHPSAVKQAATELGIPVLTPARASEPRFIASIAQLDADFAAVVAYGQILKPSLLEAVRGGWVNLHFSVLPAWRGAAPVQRAIMAGDEFTGASTFLLDEGLDTGPVIGTMTEHIRPTDTSGDLLERLADAGAPLMVRSLEALADGSAQPQAQSADGVSYAHKLGRDDAYVVWARAAHVVDRHVRACTPAPGAWTTLPDGTAARLGPVTVTTEAYPAVAGQVAFVDGRVLVGTGTAPVALSSLAPAGKKPMEAQAWWRGARLLDDAILGEA